MFTFVYTEYKINALRLSSLQLNSILIFQASYTWQNMATDKFDAEFIERRRAALEVKHFAKMLYCFPTDNKSASDNFENIWKTIKKC